MRVVTDLPEVGVKEGGGRGLQASLQLVLSTRSSQADPQAHLRVRSTQSRPLLLLGEKGAGAAAPHIGRTGLSPTVAKKRGWTFPTSHYLSCPNLSVFGIGVWAGQSIWKSEDIDSHSSVWLKDPGTVKLRLCLESWLSVSDPGSVQDSGSALSCLGAQLPAAV